MALHSSGRVFSDEPGTGRILGITADGTSGLHPESVGLSGLADGNARHF